jgi:uncharacterized membrane-anchored protein YjiN (DUF445 family)
MEHSGLPERNLNDWEAARRRDLRRFRLIASGMLLAMAGIFAATQFVEAPGFWVRLVEAASEAALVGGLADWFAVTALFRRPLGLPIPHTAVIPRNKDRIAEGMGRFIESNFLDPDLVASRLGEVNVAARLGEWLKTPGVPDALAAQLLSTVPPLLRSLRDGRLRAYMQKALRTQLERVDAAPIAGKALAMLRDADQHHVLFDHSVRAAARYLEANRDGVLRAVQKKSSWWVPKTVDRRVADAIVRGAAQVLSDLSEEDHEVRRGFDSMVERLVADLETSPDMQRRIEGLKGDLLSNARVRRYLASLWDELRDLLLAEASAPSSALRDGLTGLFDSLGEALRTDPDLQARVNGWIAETVRQGAMPWRSEIGRFIADVVRSWEAASVANRVELAVGRDLQYIRMNGTLVGALVGCAIFLIVEFI